MTTGTKVTDHTSLAWTGDQSYPSGGFTNVVYSPVGFYWSKSWNGSDNTPVPLPSVFQRHWQKVDLESSVPGSPGPKITYVERWLLRKARPRRKFQNEHPYTCTIECWSDAVHVYTWKDFYPPHALASRGWKTFRQSFSVGYSPTNAWNANDTIALRGKLREKIVGSDFNLGVALGESREALELVTNSATRIAGALRALRRGDLSSAARSLGVSPPRQPVGRGPRKGVKENLAERWLELQYGWLPLIGDAHGGAQALAQQLNEPMVQTYRARRRKVMGTNPINTLIKAGGDWGFSGFTRAQLIAKLTEVDVPTLNGLLDPATVLWELVPYSFVADWFIPIGSYLEARGLASAVEGTFIETITTREYFWCYALRNPTSGFQNWEVQPQFRYQKITVNRTVSSTLSVPLPQVKPLNEVISWKRAANAVALLITGFSGGRA